jgi:hypothetical protein
LEVLDFGGFRKKEVLEKRGFGFYKFWRF